MQAGNECQEDFPTDVASELLVVRYRERDSHDALCLGSRHGTEDLVSCLVKDARDAAPRDILRIVLCFEDHYRPHSVPTSHHLNSCSSQANKALLWQRRSHTLWL